VRAASRPSTRASKLPVTQLGLLLGASSPGRRRACVLFGFSFRGGYSPTGLPGDTAWIAFPPTGWGWLGVLSHPPPPSGSARAGPCHGRAVARRPPPAKRHRSQAPPSRRDRPGSHTPSGSCEGAPIAVAQRPARSRAPKQRCQPPVSPHEPRPASTWALGGPPQARQTLLDSPPPLRMTCERCVGTVHTSKISRAFPSVDTSPEVSRTRRGSAFKISGPHRRFLVSE